MSPEQPARRVEQVLVDRMEDITPPAAVAANPLVNRSICVMGYVRGTFLKPAQQV